MEFDFSKITSGFLFTWIIEHVSACDNSLNSPTFVATNVEKTEWKLSLNRKGALLKLKLVDFDGAAETLELDVVMSVILIGGLDNLLEKKNKLKFKRGCSKSFFLFSNETIFDGVNLKIHCYLQKSVETNASLVRCSALTHLQEERRNGIWTIENFRHLMKNSPKTFTLESTGQKLPKLVLTGELSKTFRLFHIKVSVPYVPDRKRICIIGQVSVLANDSSLKFSLTNEFIFNCRPLVQNSSAFQDTISQASVLEQSDICLTKNGSLRLMCDFFISNGEMYHEVRKSCYLPAESKLKPDSHLNIDSDIENYVPRNKIKSINQNLQDLTCKYEFQQLDERLDDPNPEYLNKKHCDAILVADNRKFPVHKSILCLKSPVFKTMFETKTKKVEKKTVYIVDMDSDTLSSFLLFLYTDNLGNLEWKSAAKLFHAADKYQVNSLKVKCSSFLESQLSIANVCEVLNLADLYQDKVVKLVCSDFVRKQEAGKIFATEEWKTFMVSNPELSAEILQKYFLMKE